MQGIQSFSLKASLIKSAVLKHIRLANPQIVSFSRFMSVSSARIEEHGFESTTIADVLKAKGKSADGSWLWCTTDDTVYDAVKSVCIPGKLCYYYCYDCYYLIRIYNVDHLCYCPYRWHNIMLGPWLLWSPENRNLLLELSQREVRNFNYFICKNIYDMNVSHWTILDCRKFYFLCLNKNLKF